MSEKQPRVVVCTNKPFFTDMGSESVLASRLSFANSFALFK